MSSIRWQSRPTLWLSAPSLVLTVALAVAPWRLVPRLAAAGVSVPPRALVLWTGVWALVALVRVGQVWCTSYVVDDERLTVTSGLFSTRTDELLLRRVQDLAVERPFLLRLLGYGHVVLSAADLSSPRTVLIGVSAPDRVHATVASLVERAQADAGFREVNVLQGGHGSMRGHAGSQGG